jgi:hypothetical protein
VDEHKFGSQNNYIVGVSGKVYQNNNFIVLKNNFNKL